MASVYKDVGSSAWQYRTGGWGEQANEFLAEWRGAGEKARRVNEMLRNSPVVAALRMAIELPIIDVEWQWTSDEGETDPRLELMRDAWARLDWRRHLSDALLYPFYGWALFTIGYEPDGGRILWKNPKRINHETIQRWVLENDEELTGVQQWPHLWPEVIPIDRMLLYRNRPNNPEGESILRPAWRSWYYVREMEQIEAIGIERNVAGMPVITLPENADSTETDSENTDYGRALRIVRNVRRDEQAGLVVPFGWEFALVSGGGAGAADTDMVISRHNKAILMSALAQFIMLGMENVGALATFEGANDFFTLAINATSDVIAEEFTNQAGVRLLRLNGYDPQGIRLTHAPVGRVEPAKIAAALQQTSDKITWTPEDESWLRDLLRLPHKDADELEALQEEAESEREARAAEMRQAMTPGEDAEEEPDDMAADIGPDVFAAEPRLTGYERQWQRKMSAFLARQGRQVARDARREYAQYQ